LTHCRYWAGFQAVDFPNLPATELLELVAEKLCSDEMASSPCLREYEPLAMLFLMFFPPES